MAKFKFIPVPAEEYDALGITENTIIETYINESGALVVKAITVEDGFVCDGNCKECPVNETDCDGECFNCPCFGKCEDGETSMPSGVCKSGGSRLENDLEGRNE